MNDGSMHVGLHCGEGGNTGRCGIRGLWVISEEIRDIRGGFSLQHAIRSVDQSISQMRLKESDVRLCTGTMKRAASISRTCLLRKKRLTLLVSVVREGVRSVLVLCC